MKKYTYQDKTYSSFYELKRQLPMVAFNPDTPENLLKKLGITVTEEPDPEPVVDPLAEAKQRRREEVATLEVEVDGMAFDGNEVAQRRMATALISWPEDKESIAWVLADNTVAQISKLQLKTALELIMSQMQEIWVKPYTDTESYSVK